MVESGTGSTAVTVPSSGGTVQVNLVVSSPDALVDLYGFPGIDTPNVVRFEGMQWAPLDADLTGVVEVDGWINSRRGEQWATDGGLTATFNTPLAAGQHVVATFTLGIAPKPGVYRARFFAGTSQTAEGNWVWLQSQTLTITVQAP